MKASRLVACWIALAPLQAGAQTTLLPDATISALASEISGETAKRHLEFIARHHRTRGSRPFRAAAEHILAELKRYGLGDAHLESLPADGRTFYGTQRSRPAWDAEFAELWELREDDGGWTPAARLASWDAMPVTLAQDSESADVTAELVDVGAGTSESAYAGKDVAGRLVLTSSQPGAVERLAVVRFGAAGIVSYAQNQRTAWWGEDEHLVRWGHLDSFPEKPTFAFMVSLKQARALRDRLARGERIRVRATVRAGRHPGSYDIVTATIPGSDAALGHEEIVFSCHLDHQRPGANDNASGCVTILEVARTIARLVADGRIPAPARTLRFVWPPEIEGTIALLNGRPEIASRIKAAVHLDMVGGGPVTKAIFHVTRGPASLPSFVYDVAEAFGALVNEQSGQFAATGQARWPLVAPEGGREALLAQVVEFTQGSDHQVYTDSSFGIPAIYLNDWPDRYIHTNFDVPANIDPTKLTRAAFIAAASGLVLANVSEKDTPALVHVIERQALVRASRTLERRAALADAAERGALTRFFLSSERAALESIGRFARMIPDAQQEATRVVKTLDAIVGPAPVPPAATGDGAVVFSRNSQLKGPLGAFGYDYFADKSGDRGRAIRLLRHQGLRGSGGEYGYEALNLVDGRRTARDVRDALSAMYGPVPLDVVVEYLQALESIGVIRR